MDQFGVFRWTNDGNRLSVYNMKHVVEQKIPVNEFTVGTTGIAKYPGYPGLWKFRLLRIGDKNTMERWLKENFSILLEDAEDSFLGRNGPVLNQNDERIKENNTDPVLHVNQNEERKKENNIQKVQSGLEMSVMKKLAEETLKKNLNSVQRKCESDHDDTTDNDEDADPSCKTPSTKQAAEPIRAIAFSKSSPSRRNTGSSCSKHNSKSPVTSRASPKKAAKRKYDTSDGEAEDSSSEVAENPVLKRQKNR